MTEHEMTHPPTRAIDVAALDAAIEKSVAIVRIDDLKAGGHTHIRVFSRKQLLGELLQVVEAFGIDRIRQAEVELGGIVDRREAEAKEEGRMRILASLAELADLVDSMLERFSDGDAATAAKAMDKRIDRIFKTHGFERTPTVGTEFDPTFHEIVDEVVDASTSPGTITKEVTRGYRKDDFALRIARVVVAKAG